MNAFYYNQRLSARILAAVALFSLVAGLVPMQAFAVPTVQYEYNEDAKIKICHANANEFSDGKQEVDKSTIFTDGNAHGSHDVKGLDNMGDIIESFTYEYRVKNSNDPWIQGVYSGKNLTTNYSVGLTGLQILNNGCEVLTTGSLTVIKEVKNDNGGTKLFSDFPLFITLGAGSPVSVTSGVAKTTLVPGTYTVSETPDSNYTATFSASCPNGVISLAAGENKTCTITNDDKAVVSSAGTIIIVKNTVGGNGTFNFISQTLGNFSLTTTAGTASQTFSNKNVGTYAVSETIPEGWNLTSATCSDQSPVNAISLQADETVTCTFTNTAQGAKTGIFRIIKRVIGKVVADYSIFSFSLDGNPTPTPFETDGSNDVIVSVGAHTAVESKAAGYNTVHDAGCTAAQIAEGQTSTCTITNTWIPTCNDGIKNQEETSVDTGGPCPTEPVTCQDDGATNYNQVGACTYNYQSVCITPDANLLTNASFENPVIAGPWSASVVTDWVITKVSDSTATLSEIWRGLSPSSNGAQHLELDGTEPAKITQSVATIPGATYELRFDFAARSGTAAANNAVLATANATTVVSATTGNNNWTTYGNTFVAGTNSTAISLADIGTPADSLGTLVDNAVLCLVRPPAQTQGTLEVVKIMVGTTTVDESNFSFKLDGGATTTFETDGTNSLSLVAGTYDVVETSAPGYTTTYNNCDNVVVTTGQTSTCTITNTLITSTPQVCSVNAVSNLTNTVNAAGTVIVEDQPGVWVDNIVGSLAQWIWGAASTSPISGSVDETQTFTKTFVWNGPVTGATLKLATDNMYSVTLNGTEVASSTDPDNFTSLDTVVNIADNIVQGTNTLAVSVTNDANGATSLNSFNGNPAGLIYDLTVAGNTQDNCTQVPGGGNGGGNGGNGGGGNGGGGNRGGGGTRVDRTPNGDVLGASDSPKPLVLGDQVSAVPAGAPNTGKGGTATVVLGQFLALPRRRNV